MLTVLAENSDGVISYNWKGICDGEKVLPLWVNNLTCVFAMNAAVDGSSPHARARPGCRS